MSGNPLINQGTINKVRGSATFSDFPALNVTAAYLGKDGITMNPEGHVTTSLPTQTGVVQALEPFVLVRFSLNLLKTQSLASAYKLQIESNSVVGNVTLRFDSKSLPDYTLVNCAITGTPTINSSGSSAEFTVEMMGVYYINSTAWNI